MANTVDKVIKVALAEVGYLEKKTNKNLDSKTANAGSNNYTKYARDLDKLGYFYNGKKNGYAWCDCFTDWCFVQAYGVDDALKLLCQPKKSYGAGVRYSANYYIKKKQFHKKDPKVGDQIFFYKKNKIQLAHTGIVVDVDDTYVYTVEGNTSGASGVIANGGGVNKKKYKLNYSLIYGYGRPNYDEDKRDEIIVPSTPSIPSAPSVPNVDSGSKELKAGTKLKLSKVALYASSSAKNRAGLKTGTYYIWSATAVNGRVRITNRSSNVGKAGRVTGWISSADAKKFVI